MPLAWIAATLLGAFVPAAIVSVMPGGFIIPGIWLATFAVTLAHAVVLGLPIALVYRAERWQWPGLAVVTGFLIGAVPMGFVTWPVETRPGASTWVNGVVVSVDGIPTLAGWLDFLRFLGVFGALGAVGALAFWLTLRWAGALDDPSSE